MPRLRAARRCCARLLRGRCLYVSTRTSGRMRWLLWATRALLVCAKLTVGLTAPNVAKPGTPCTVLYELTRRSSYKPDAESTATSGSRVGTTDGNWSAQLSPTTSSSARQMQVRPCDVWRGKPTLPPAVTRGGRERVLSSSREGQTMMHNHLQQRG